MHGTTHETITRLKDNKDKSSDKDKSNNKDKHPDRNCMDIDKAGEYIKWLINQPNDVNINEVAILC